MVPPCVGRQRCYLLTHLPSEIGIFLTGTPKDANRVSSFWQWPPARAFRHKHFALVLQFPKFCFQKCALAQLKKASCPLITGKERKLLTPVSSRYVLCFGTLLFILPTLLVQLKRLLAHWGTREAAKHRYWLQNAIKGPPVNGCLCMAHFGILVLIFPEVKYLLPSSACFCFRKLMLTWTMFSPICCHYWINEKWQNHTSSSFES